MARERLYSSKYERGCTREQISMRSKIRKMFPKKRISISLSNAPYESTRRQATIHFLGSVDHHEAEAKLNRSGMFKEVCYQWMLQNFWVRW